MDISEKKMQLRPVQTMDYAQLVGWISDAHACARWAGPDMAFPFSSEELPALLKVAQGPSFCLTDDTHNMLGFGQYFDKGAGIVRLARIIIAPSQRGQGLAKTLCQLLMQQARQELRVQAFSLAVFRDNLAAVSCYLQLGFVVVEEKSSDYRWEMVLPVA